MRQRSCLKASERCVAEKMSLMMKHFCQITSGSLERTVYEDVKLHVVSLTPAAQVRTEGNNAARRRP